MLEIEKFIYIRSSLDWHKIKTIDDFIAANVNARPLLKDWMPELISSIKKWNKSFGVDYFNFRKKLKEVSLLNLGEVPNAKIINEKTKDVLNQSDSFLLYITDDDDWACPQIFEVIEKKLQSFDDVIIWPFGFFRHNTVITDTSKPIDNIRWAYSNNAVLTKKGYNAVNFQHSDFLENHRTLDEIIQDKKLNVHVIDDVLSAYNHSPASATKMWSFGKKCSEEIFDLLEGYEASPYVPSELKWAEPYAKIVWENINKLKNKKVFL